jgi:uncharacterized alpha-E superfamily protein
MRIRCDMISRIAEHCFWMFRYLERSEILARTLFAAHLTDLDGRERALDQESFLLSLSPEKPLFLKLYNGKEASDHELIQHFMTWQELNINSLLNCIKATRTNAQLIREVISEGMWQVINGLHLWISQESTQQLYMTQRYTFYSQILEYTQLFKGHFYNSLLRDDYFHLMDLGIHLERAQQVFNMLDRLNPLGLLSNSIMNEESEDQFALLSFLLDSFASNENYLKQEQDFKLSSLVEFFLSSRQSPYSLEYCLNKCDQNFSSLSINEQKLFHQPGNLIHKLLNFLPGVKQLAILNKDVSAEKQIIKSSLYEISNSLQSLFSASIVN